MTPETYWDRVKQAAWTLAPRFVVAWKLRRRKDFGRGDYDCLWCGDCSGCECCWPIGTCHA